VLRYLGFVQVPLIHEIKGLKLEQVDELYATVSKAWKSTKFRQLLSFREVDEVDTRKKLREISDMVNRKRITSAGSPEAQTTNYDEKTT